MTTPLEVFSKILLNELVFFPQVQVTPELTVAWYSHFKEVEPSEFRAALRSAIDKNTTGFPPTPGQVWSVINSLRATDDDFETAEEAWASIWGSVKGMSALAEQAGRLMHDFSNRGHWQYDTYPWKKREFERIYNSLKEKKEAQKTQIQYLPNEGAMLTGNETAKKLVAMARPKREVEF